MELPEFPDGETTIAELVSILAYADARIIDAPPVRQKKRKIPFF